MPLEDLHLHVVPAAEQIADGALQVIDRNCMPKWCLSRCQAHPMQFRLNGEYLYASALSAWRIISGLDCDRIFQRLAVWQIVKKNKAISWENTACSTRRWKVVHGIDPRASLER